MYRHLRRRHHDNVVSWQTRSIRSFIETLCIQTMKLFDKNHDVTAASSGSDDIQETQVPLMIGADSDDVTLTFDSCPSAFLTVDSSWSAPLH